MLTNKVGVTERGDAGLDFSWESKLGSVDFAIVITKNINDRFINSCLNNKDKLIIHATITGYGGSVLEPNVPTVDTNYMQLKKLVASGFPVQQIVLRVDPIIPTPKGIDTAESVLKLFKDIGITRCRYSYLDMYTHVQQRFLEANLRLPYMTFNASSCDIACCESMLADYTDTYDFECCGERYSVGDICGCISQKDVDILKSSVILTGNASQRKVCHCPSNKLELLSTPRRCQHKCIYCYWKD